MKDSKRKKIKLNAFLGEFKMGIFFVHFQYKNKVLEKVGKKVGKKHTEILEFCNV